MYTIFISSVITLWCVCSAAQRTTRYTNDTKLLLFGIICDKWVQGNFHQLRLAKLPRAQQRDTERKKPFTRKALLRIVRSGNRINHKAETKNKTKTKWSEILNLFSNNKWLQIWLHICTQSSEEICFTKSTMRRSIKETRHNFTWSMQCG